MTAKKLKSMYNGIWEEIYTKVVTDLRDCMPKDEIDNYNKNKIKSKIHRIAFNAAFNACYTIYVRLVLS